MMVLPTIEGLLDDWRNGKYIEVAETLERMGPKYVSQFCVLLIKYEGVNQVLILDKFIN